jgi:hypothetical protein
LFAERKNVDKIRPFQIDEKGLPAKIHGSKKGKSGRRDALSSPLRMKTKIAKEGTLCLR